MSINRWKLNKAGILNYWYYDEKVFNFADGRMLLRGSNGSGKSVTMQSLITILLDGNTRASRLDSFGSTARRIDDYLLGEKEISETDERTGYLYLEYKRENSDQYITTGIGLHAVRNSTTPIGFWGFILKDKRINKDVKLYKTVKDADGRAGKAIYNRRELTDAIGSSGIVVTSRDEYARLVNRNIFGFSDEKYAELVTLLIQLRSPKLSRDFKPTVVYDILNNSLPAIPEEELRPLTETLDNIRNIRAKKERLKKELAIFERLCRLYENANRAAIFEKYNKYVEADRSLRASRNNLNEVKSLLVQAELDKAIVERQYSDLRVEEKALKAEQEELQRNDIYHAIEEKEKIENDLKELRSELDKKEKDLDDKHKKEIQYKSQIVEQDNVIYKYEKNGDEIKDEMNYLAAECDFAANEDMMNSFKWNVSDDFFPTWEGMISNYKKKLQEVRDILREYDEYNSKYENKRSDYGEMSRQQDELNQNLADSEKDLENEKEQIIKSLYEWENKYSDCLEISADQHSSMIENIRNLYENEISWNNVLTYLDKLYNDAQQKINRKIADIEHRIEICGQELKRLNDELQILLSKKEIEPALPEEVILSRKKMKNAGISFIPFYEAVEYRPGLSDTIKERIESVLLSSGILQGIILQDNKSVKLLCQGFCDAVINSSNKQISGATLSNYLVSSDNESGISKERIIAILSSISIDEQALINRNMDISKVDIKAGIYHTGTIYGKAPMRDKAIYIGKKSREEFRIRQIHMLEEAISALEDDKKGLEADRKRSEIVMKHLEEARRNFPSNDAIEDIHLRITSLEREISQQSEKMAALQEKMDELVKLLREYKNKIASKKVSANLKLNKKSYEDAIDNLIEYRNNLKNFQMVQKDHLNAEMSRRQCIELMEEVLSDMDDIRDDISRIEFKVKYNVQRVTTLTEMLKEKDIQGLKDRISKILQRLEEIPNINENLINRKAHLTNDISRYNQNIIDSEHRISMYEIIKRSWLKLLEAEKGYSEKLKLDDNLERIRDYLKGQKEPDSFNKSIERFNKQYNDDRGMLTDYYIDYNIIDMDLGDIPQVDIQDREFYDQIANLRDNSSRIVLVSRLDGREASIFQQRDDIDLHIRQQEEMLSEEDKKIYKDIILNNIGRSISQKIYEADDWIRSMNKLMKESETSNGLRFHLEWKAERQDDGIDTNVIVNLLHADPDTLREDDMERIKRFFDYKVQRAREIAVASEDSSDGKRITFYDCIREMLDYRNWYRFRLQYEKTNMSKRELTDKTFMKFSGGEKAMAMYVPLFSAVYSKYQEGSKEAPYIITLDEAFAGVDEQNIRDMFKMVEQLNFNYIMNSQALWGDYDVVPSLNIYELLRPNNSSCVTVVTSHWNGSSREIIFNDIETGGIDD